MKKLISSACVFSMVFGFVSPSFAATHKKKYHKATSSTSLQQQVNDLKANQKTLEKKVEDQNEYIEKQKGNWSNKFEAGWKKGLYFQTADGKYSTKFRIQIQPQYSYTTASQTLEGKDNQSTFRIRRAKFSWEGNLFSKNLDYKFQLNAAVSNWQDALEDAYVNYKFFEPLRVQFGQEKVQYDRQTITSSGRRDFVETSIAANEFQLANVDTTVTTTCTLASGETISGVGINCGGTPAAKKSTKTTYTQRRSDYDTGLIVWGTPFDRKMEYYLGVMNSGGANRLDLNNRPALTARLVWNPLGNYGYSESDVEYSEHPSLTVAGSGMFYKQDTTNTQISQAGAELGFKYKGGYLQAEYYLRQNNPQATNPVSSTNSRDQGYYVQGGYFIIPRHFEVNARASQIFFGGPNNNKSEYTAGLNYYFLGHDLKILTNYSYLPVQTAKGTAKDQRFALQLQAWF